MATPQAERLSQLGSAQQRARVLQARQAGEAMSGAYQANQARQQELEIARRRRQYAEKLQAGTVTLQDIRQGVGAGISDIQRQAGRVGTQETYGQAKEAEEAAEQTAQESGVGLDQARAAQMKSAMAAAVMNIGRAGQKDEDQKTTDAIRAEVRKKVKRTAKAGFKRGTAFVIGSIAAVIDMGTWVTTIIDAFYYVAIFGWMNVQMIYGSYMAKGKSFIVDPLDWEPLPLKGVISPILLHIALIAADILIILAFSAFFGFAFLIITVIAQIIVDPAGFALNTISGASDLGLISDMIRQALGY